MANGDKYPREFERINSEMSRIQMPFGWYVVFHAHIISGGKDIHVAQDVHRYYDPDHKWQLKEK